MAFPSPVDAWHNETLGASAKTSKASSPNLNLTVRTIIGTTASSCTGFTCLASSSCYAVCAGSYAVVGFVDQEFNVKQRILGAKADTTALLGNGSYEPVSAPSTPDFRVRSKASLGPPATPLGSTTAAPRSNAFSRAEVIESPGKGVLRTRSRSVTCIACSPDAKILAVGETGYSARILLYSLIEDDSVGPCAALTEHTTGVRALRFSDDSRWLCSVGDIHDGSILLWSVGGPKSSLVKLYARNKCSSSVNDLAWMGQDIVTVGVRQVKVWRPDYTSAPRSPAKVKLRLDGTDSPSAMGSSFRALPGRNTLLGPLLDSSFTAVVALSKFKAVVATDRGEICLLDNSQSTQAFSILKTIRNAISCMTATGPSEMWVGVHGIQGGEIHRIHLDLDSCEPLARYEDSNSPSLRKGATNLPQPVALGVIRNRIVSLNSARNLQVFGVEQGMIELRQQPYKCWIGHSGPVMGILRSHTVQSGFTTWDSAGLVISRSLPEGRYLCSREIELDTPADAEQPNELRVLKFARTVEEQTAGAIDSDVARPATSATQLFVCGDRYGMIKLLDCDWKASASSSVKAHDGEINDIALCSADAGSTLIASAGRDRMIQIFLKEPTDPPLRLVQTIDCHGSSVNRLIFCSKRRFLLSASTDRTVSINVLAFNQSDAVAFVPAKTITLKGTPIGMTIGKPDTLLISTMDKQVQRYDLQSCQPADAFRPLDTGSGAIALGPIESGNICSEESSQRIVLGVCPSDRSIRVHCAISGATLAKQVGHTDGTSDVAFFTASENGDFCYTIVSTGADGTVFISSLMPDKSPSQHGSNGASISISAYTPPLRRVLSRVALSDFSRSSEANGQPAVYATPTRLRSPTRLRKKKSDYSLMGRGTMPALTKGGSRHRSPSPVASTERKVEKERPSLVSRQRMQSADGFENTVYSAEGLSKALRSFRRNLGQGKGQTGTLKELELELFLTQEYINKKTGRQSVSQEDRRKLHQDLLN